MTRRDLRKRGLACGAVGVVYRQEEYTRRDGTLGRKVDADIVFRGFFKKRIWKSGEHPRAVAGVYLGSAGSAMVHPAQDVTRVLDD